MAQDQKFELLLLKQSEVIEKIYSVKKMEGGGKGVQDGEIRVYLWQIHM